MTPLVFKLSVPVFNVLKYSLGSLLMALITESVSRLIARADSNYQLTKNRKVLPRRGTNRIFRISFLPHTCFVSFVFLILNALFICVELSLELGTDSVPNVQAQRENYLGLISFTGDMGRDFTVSEKFMECVAILLNKASSKCMAYEGEKIRSFRVMFTKQKPRHVRDRLCGAWRADCSTKGVRSQHDKVFTGSFRMRSEYKQYSTGELIEGYNIPWIRRRAENQTIQPQPLNISPALLLNFDLSGMEITAKTYVHPKKPDKPGQEVLEYLIVTLEEPSGPGVVYCYGLDLLMSNSSSEFIPHSCVFDNQGNVTLLTAQSNDNYVYSKDKILKANKAARFRTIGHISNLPKNRLNDILLALDEQHTNAYGTEAIALRKWAVLNAHLFRLNENSQGSVQIETFSANIRPSLELWAVSMYIGGFSLFAIFGILLFLCREQQWNDINNIRTLRNIRLRERERRIGVEDSNSSAVATYVDPELTVIPMKEVGFAVPADEAYR